jgi:hypothetical protein
LGLKVKVLSGELRTLPKTIVGGLADAAGVLAVRLSEPAIDFIFIDDDHSYGALRQEAWSGLVWAGGFIALHDGFSSAARNIDGACSVIYTREAILRDTRYRLVESVDTLSVLERNAL